MPRRDWDQIRNLMLVAESLDKRDFSKANICSSEKEEFQFDCMLDAGLLRWSDGQSEQSINYAVKNGLAVRRTISYWISSEGHDYLDAVRDEKIWAKTIKTVNAISGATLSAIMGIAVAYGKQAVEEKFGLKL